MFTHFMQSIVYQKLIIRPQNNSEDVPHILTLNKKDEVTLFQYFRQNPFPKKFGPQSCINNLRQKSSPLKPTDLYIKRQRNSEKLACRAVWNNPFHWCIVFVVENCTQHTVTQYKASESAFRSVSYNIGLLTRDSLREFVRSLTDIQYRVVASNR